MVSSDAARLAFDNHETPFSYDKVRLALDDDATDSNRYFGDAIDEAGCMMWLILSEVGTKAREHCLNDGRKTVTEEDIIAGFDSVIPRW